MASLLKRLVTWWDGDSIGTRLFTSRFGNKVGEDAQGNVFYSNADDSRRWVIYDGDNDATRVDPEWYGWLHHTFKQPPTEAPLAHKTWEKPHQTNLTGTDGAFLRQGSIRRADVKPASDYEAWSPE
ncbi:NADH:ubiquinone oxidoreductase subunit NDUFA12 [Jannaschia sp. M317]|uniref:NADH:ubiquinone oxidoreductase subunit NDUFA12 n=1 Tax=Jannaschia sp. M317 TaxID=2867011 RepID=UPI0021A7F121|nr:NADH:ubiquinone oxidoreductase subunit NDUFA12 [Jannaschia sp. M317]UWQ19203.1 NADH:ubiquinone oxidoreductase subunit NDUFA12 [Jannaschia sp. M317]